MPRINSINSSILINEIQESVTTILQEAKQASDIEKKKTLFEKAYTILIKQVPSRRAHMPLEWQKLFFELLHDHAKETLYAQTIDGDDEKGFILAANMMQFSLMLQTEMLGFEAVPIRWNLIQSLKELALVDVPLVLEADKKTLQESPLSEISAKTCQMLAYCYQNIDSKQSIELHKMLDSYVCCLFENNKEALVDYLYNRSAFIVSLSEPNNFETQLKSYDTVVIKVSESFPENHPKALSLLAQVANMRGILTLKQNKNPLGYFKEAFKIRQKLVQITEADDEKFKQKFLLANIRTSIIVCLLKKSPKTSKDILKLQSHAKALDAHLEEASLRKDNHSYYSAYIPLIQEAKKTSLSIKEYALELFSSCGGYRL